MAVLIAFMIGSADLIRYHLNELKPWAKWSIICSFCVFMVYVLIHALGIDINHIIKQHHGRSII